jgi:hypothetical protein
MNNVCFRSCEVQWEPCLQDCSSPVDKQRSISPTLGYPTQPSPTIPFHSTWLLQTWAVPRREKTWKEHLGLPLNLSRSMFLISPLDPLGSCRSTITYQCSATLVRDVPPTIYDALAPSTASLSGHTGLDVDRTKTTGPKGSEIV